MAGTAWKLAGAAAAMLAIGAIGLLGARLLVSRDTPDEPAPAAALPRAAAAEGAARAAEAAPVERAPEPPATLHATGRVLLHGFVADSAGDPIPDADIAWTAGGRGDDSTRSWSATDRATAADGEYAIPDLRPGLVTFRVEAKGCQPLDLTLDLAGRSGEQRHDFVLARTLVIPVKLVTPGGEPLLSTLRAARADVDVTSSLALRVSEAGDRSVEQLRASTATVVEGATTAGRGMLATRMSGLRRPELPEGADGVIEIARLPVEAWLLMKHVAVAHQTVTSAAAPVTFTLDPARLDACVGRLTAMFVDAESREPVAGLQVGIGTDSAGSGGVATKGDGLLDVACAPGWIKIHLWSPAHETWHRHVLVEPGETTDLGEIELEHGLTLTGSLRTIDGKPARAHVGVLRLDTHERGAPFFTNDYAGSSEPGKLQVNLGRGRYVLLAGSEDGGRAGGAAIAVVDVTSGVLPPPLEIALAPATAVHVAPRLRPGETLHAELTTADGVLVWANDVAAAPAAIYRALPSGSYVVSLFDRGRLVRAVPFEARGEHLLVEFDAHGEAPPRISVEDPLLHRQGLTGDPAPTDPVRPVAAAAKEPRLVIEGSVRDRAGAPIAGASVMAVEPSGRRRSARTSPHGGFAVAGLSPGPIDVVVAADGFGDVAERAELHAGAPPPRVDAVLEPVMRVQVRLTDLAGEPLSLQTRRTFPRLSAEDVTVVATLAPPDERLPSSTLGIGRWRPSDRRRLDEPGTLTLTAPPPLFVSAVFGGRVVATRELAAPVDELALPIDPTLLESAAAKLRFRLVDAADGAPILEAFAAVSSPSTHTGGKPTVLPPESNGVREFGGLEPGRRRLSILLADGTQWSSIVTLAPATTTDLGDVPIVRGVEIAGVVVDEEGRPPKASVRVLLYDADDAPSFEGSVSMDLPDPQGAFRVRVPAARARFEISGRDYALDPLVVDTRQAAASGVRLVARRGTMVTLRPHRSLREPLRVALHRSDGELLRELTFTSPVPQQLRLVPGTYRLVATRDSTLPAEHTFEVAPTPTDVPLPR